MNKKLISSSVAAMVLAMLLIFNSCQKTPTACFEVSKTTAAVNEQIAFDASCSKNADSCEWDFGDGTKSRDFKTTHAYAAIGQYTVSMMTMSGNGKKMDEIKKTITIQ